MAFTGDPDAFWYPLMFMFQVNLYVLFLSVVVICYHFNRSLFTENKNIYWSIDELDLGRLEQWIAVYRLFNYSVMIIK